MNTTQTNIVATPDEIDRAFEEVAEAIAVIIGVRVPAIDEIRAVDGMTWSPTTTRGHLANQMLNGARLMVDTLSDRAIVDVAG